jgi:hypothetical protein
VTTLGLVVARHSTVMGQTLLAFSSNLSGNPGPVASGVYTVIRTRRSWTGFAGSFWPTVCPVVVQGQTAV